MHKDHNYHAILHKLYMWFGKNELRLYLKEQKKFDWGPRGPPLNTPMGLTHFRGEIQLINSVQYFIILYKFTHDHHTFHPVKVQKSSHILQLQQSSILAFLIEMCDYALGR